MYYGFERENNGDNNQWKVVGKRFISCCYSYGVYGFNLDNVHNAFSSYGHNLYVRLRGGGEWQIYYFTETLVRFQCIGCVCVCVCLKEIYLWKCVIFTMKTNKMTKQKHGQQHKTCELVFSFRVILEWFWTFYYLCYFSSAYIKWHLYWVAISFLILVCSCVCVSEI